MTADQFAAVIAREVSDRVSEAVRDLYRFCEAHDEPLSRRQRFAVGSLPLRVTLSLEESVAVMTRTYTAIRALTPELPDFPDELADAWLRDVPTERSH